MFSHEELYDAWYSAESRGASQFTFQGHELVTKFAFYLLEYLAGICERRHVKKNVKLFEFSRGSNEIFIGEQSLN